MLFGLSAILQPNKQKTSSESLPFANGMDLQNIRYPNLYVGSVFQVLDIRQVFLKVKTRPRLEISRK